MHDIELSDAKTNPRFAIRSQKTFATLILMGCVTLFGFTSQVSGQTQTDTNSAKRLGPTPLELVDIFGLEYADDPQISPDGTRIVFVRHSMDIMKDRGRSHLWIVNADGSGLRPLTSGERNDSSPVWSPTGDRIAFRSTESGSAQIHVYWFDQNREAVISHLERTPGSLQWSPDGRHLAFSMFVPAKSQPLVSLSGKPEGAQWAAPATVVTDWRYRSDGSGFLKPGFQQIFTLPVIGGTPRQLTSGDYNHSGDFCWSSDGQSIIFSANRSEDPDRQPLDTNLFRIGIQNRDLEQLTDRVGPDANPILSADGRFLAYTGFTDELLGYQTDLITVLDLVTGTSTEVVPQLNRPISSLAWSDSPRQLFFSYDSEGESQIAVVTIGSGNEQKPIVGEPRVVAESLGGTTLGRPYPSGSYSVSDNGRLAYTICSAQSPAEVAFVDVDGSVKQLTYLNEDLFLDRKLGAVEEIWVKSSFDEHPVQGWIVKPPGFEEGKKYPLLLEIHGGPFLNYGPRFAMELQLYAAAGYVVVYANPRGSTSYGNEFANFIHHNYPSEDYDDLMTIVDGVIEKGYVDEERLFVTGGSGGGVLTAWIVGHTDRFKAAVVAKPVINWYSFVLTADMSNYFYKYWFEAPPWEAPESYLKRSPLSYVGNVSTPTMLLTGEEDYRTPMSETEQYYQALKIRGVESAMVRIPGAGHGITARPSNLMSKVAHILKWFEMHDPSTQESDE